jgi:hypothetical protein
VSGWASIRLREARGAGQLASRLLGAGLVVIGLTLLALDR